MISGRSSSSRTTSACCFSSTRRWTRRTQDETISLKICGSTLSVNAPLSISEKTSIIAEATATVGLDTGLSHIAAALSIPSVTLYGATDPKKCGAIGERQVHIASDFECVKCHEKKCSYDGRSKDEPACFVSLKPDKVWHELEELIEKTTSGSREVYQLV